tara:strand:- start:17 stop:343 length:327 start_codon:yes stop_codon:yes gene_type:complete
LEDPRRLSGRRVKIWCVIFAGERWSGENRPRTALALEALAAGDNVHTALQDEHAAVARVASAEKVGALGKDVDGCRFEEGLNHLLAPRARVNVALVRADQEGGDGFEL